MCCEICAYGDGEGVAVGNLVIDNRLDVYGLQLKLDRHINQPEERQKDAQRGTWATIMQKNGTFTQISDRGVLLSYSYFSKKNGPKIEVKHPFWRWFVTLENKSSYKSLGYICSNSQQYIVWVKMIDFPFMPNIIRILSKDHVPWRYSIW